MYNNINNKRTIKKRIEKMKNKNNRKNLTNKETYGKITNKYM